MKTKNKKKRNIIKHVWGFFHSYLRKQDAHELWRENSVIFLPYEVRAFYFIKGSSNVVFVLKLMKILRILTLI